jgi:hypothetical protein
LRRLRAPALLALLLAALAGTVSACGDDAPEFVDPGPSLPLELLALRAPADLLPGTRIEADTRGVLSDADPVVLELAGASLVADAIDAGVANFTLGAESYAALPSGEGALDARLRQGSRASAPLALDASVGAALSLSLDALPGGTYFRRTEYLLTGAGFVDSDEGALVAHVTGTFTPADGGAARSVDTRVPARLVDFTRRDRATIALGAALGGVGPGELAATVRLERRLAGAEDISEARPLDLGFAAPTLTGTGTAELALGQYLNLRGGGLLGMSGGAETTLVRIEGAFRSAYAEPGDPSEDIGPIELLAIVDAHDAARLELPFEEREGRLLSSVFGDDRGTFTGTLTPVVLGADDEAVGEPLAVELTLLGVHQHIEVVFLPSFFESLREFGLSQASAAVVEQALARMNAIYADYPVYFALEPALDFVERARARLEVGGPDPNGRGLLGYDNTAGKDIGNVRLYDVIGGANAETQADGFPGYGGVFIESFLYWSAAPGLPGERPSGAPPEDPLFDELFGPVRATPATLAELGDCSGARCEAVARAVGALANMIGETAAHEVGHSLGLAQPFGGRDAFHSALPGLGCLMDTGRDRPLGERAAQPGFEPTRFCAEEGAYLREILGTTGAGAD